MHKIIIVKLFCLWTIRFYFKHSQNWSKLRFDHKFVKFIVWTSDLGKRAWSICFWNSMNDLSKIFIF